MKTVPLLLLVAGGLLLSHCQPENKQNKELPAQKAETQSDTINYETLGLTYAKQTQGILAKNLMAAIKKTGTEGALEFCNHKAYPLTDSMATALSAHLKRVTDKARNPNNQASEEELKHIEAFKKALSQGEKPKPIFTEKDNQVLAYYPIMTNSMCLQCHGKPQENILAPTLQKIAQLYPKDQAQGYAENEIRGMWVVKMDKK